METQSKNEGKKEREEREQDLPTAMQKSGKSES